MKKVMKQIGLIILVVFATLFIIGFIYSLVDSDKETTTIKPEKEEVKKALSEFKTSNADFNSEMKKGFMDSCVGDNPSETKFCNCSYDYMINKIGISGMMDISIEVLNNKMSEKTIDLMSDAIIYCH